MQVPAYCPDVLGVQDQEKRGVLLEVKKTIAIESIPIIVVPDGDDVGIELPVEEVIGIDMAIDISEIVIVEELAMEVCLPV